MRRPSIAAHMVAMDPILWLSFDGTLPVPALASPTALPRESVIDLFERGRELTQLKWTANGVWIRPEDHENWDEADLFEVINVEGVEMYDFTASHFEFNIDTEQMTELGYRGYFVPGGGIVVENPDTPVVLAAGRFIEDLQGILGRYAPERLNSWAEYAAAVPNLERAFALAGVERHEREKRERVAALVDDFLSGRAAFLPTEGTVRADQMAVNTVLEAVDVRWWSHSPEREVFVVTAIESSADGMLAVTFSTRYGQERTRLVRPDRRFTLTRP